jgi:hypothetical protein
MKGEGKKVEETRGAGKHVGNDVASKVRGNVRSLV